MERKILLTPGPATTSDAVKNAQVIPDICPREKEFGEIMEEISEKLVGIAGGKDDYACILFGGSGTAGVEAIVSSVVPLGKKILILNNGAYGERMREIAECYKINCVEHCTEWGSPIDLARLEKELEKDEEIEAVGMVHHETTTGILNPLKGVGENVIKYNRVFIADTISSFAGIPFSVEETFTDFIVSTSNKCIQGMPGVFFVIAKKSALEKTKNWKRNLYLNLYEQYSFLKKNKQMRFTAPVQTIYSLKKAIEELEEEGGVKKRYERYKENWEILVAGMEKLGFRRFKPEVHQSYLLSAFYEPNVLEYDFEKMHHKLYERGFTIYPGKLKEKTFRLANIGAIDKKDIESFLENLKLVMEEMNLRLRD